MRYFYHDFHECNPSAKELCTRAAKRYFDFMCTSSMIWPFKCYFFKRNKKQPPLKLGPIQSLSTSYNY